MLIYVKMPTIVGILTFISMINIVCILMFISMINIVCILMFNSMKTIVCILIFISMINKTSQSLKARKIVVFSSILVLQAVEISCS